jgi:hypothetical protein
LINPIRSASCSSATGRRETVGLQAADVHMQQATRILAGQSGADEQHHCRGQFPH